MSKRLPEFIGLGVQKGGTTTLQRLLEQHPGVFLPPSKELHYFTLNYLQGEDWYRYQFSKAQSGQLCGEVTPYYFFHPQVPQRIETLLPNARLILLLRDPVDRCVSQYFHSRRLGLEPLGLEEALAAEDERLEGSISALEAIDGRHRSHQEHSYLSRSRYEQQLPHWQQRFSADQLLILRSEDLFLSPQKVWEQVLIFLGLQYVPLPALSQPANAGSGEAKQLPEPLWEFLRQQLNPTYAWVAEHTGIRWSK
ncbi:MULTISPECIES: sulfotransferase family protein [Prochlorococcus]|uniref:sulfotransferase family protein n=1 Tax=Prochlorococcus TaxID=1218 RepID=UPI0007B380CC|nr:MULTISPECIES: sulfotransferase [Prochlorococcus]KZR66173.1 Sulfotransferase domain protein [Prochlorococcus marinus str. MIT 1312]KZR83005.1 Sulfotransferase domain protein [Prochlorococcus marinus str. MIT 1327]NMP05479.1 sulfotransferase domain-containing protein [Prochlorococcus sp. P1361]NMP13057.1 sulfotransferase domain-containing protein [Prochlorococcus sp.P1363]